MYDAMGRKVLEGPLAFSGEVSVFAGEITLPAAGPYLLEVVASQPDTQNFGRSGINIEVNQ